MSKTNNAALLAACDAAYANLESAREANAAACERWGAEGTDESEAAWSATAEALDAADRAHHAACEALAAAMPQSDLGRFDD